MNERTGWHWHTTWRSQAWTDEGCPDPKTAIPIAPDDPRVLHLKAESCATS